MLASPRLVNVSRRLLYDDTSVGADERNSFHKFKEFYRLTEYQPIAQCICSLWIRSVFPSRRRGKVYMFMDLSLKQLETLVLRLPSLEKLELHFIRITMEGMEDIDFSSRSSRSLTRVVLDEIIFQPYLATLPVFLLILQPESFSVHHVIGDLEHLEDAQFPFLPNPTLRCPVKRLRLIGVQPTISFLLKSPLPDDTVTYLGGNRIFSQVDASHSRDP